MLLVKERIVKGKKRFAEGKVSAVLKQRSYAFPMQELDGKQEQFH